MTLCMAYTDGETTWVSADTVTSSQTGWRWPYEAQKWIPLHGWMAGLSGSTQIRHAIMAAEGETEVDAEPIELMAAIWKHHIARGYKPPHKDGDMPEYDSVVILARPGRVALGNWFGDATDVPAGRVICIGQGQEIAYGAFDALMSRGATAPEAMRQAHHIVRRYFPIIDGYWSITLEKATS